ncbi:DUF4167 domain-containing protein [Sphingomonas endophytica]|uniref:DUF4167 domain-containing protein n=1 Tax=Sphingomonas endophytica TaxID=869719 RepID=UPI002892E75A|nr:DUF4167 domain-containing protein [Sphingomonas endophytica]
MDGAPALPSSSAAAVRWPWQARVTEQVAAPGNDCNPCIGSECRFWFQDEDSELINNRQNGRRRGRGGGQQQRQGGGGHGQRDSGNRIDSRARGNAAQLLEKYKNMARDAQMAGDRVNTEYYLQFADHYFRVLADQRGRSDDQQPMRRQRDDFDQFDDGDDFGDEGDAIRAEEQPRASESESGGRGERFRDQRAQQRDDRPREDRQREDRPRGERQRDNRPAYVEQQQPEQVVASEPDVTVAASEEDAAPRRRRARKPREEAASPAEQAPAFDADRLPPALGTTAEPIAGEEGEAPKPRRRRVRATPAEAAAAE